MGPRRLQASEKTCYFVRGEATRFPSCCSVWGLTNHAPAWRTRTGNRGSSLRSVGARLRGRTGGCVEQPVGSAGRRSSLAGVPVEPCRRSAGWSAAARASRRRFGHGFGRRRRWGRVARRGRARPRPAVVGRRSRCASAAGPVKRPQPPDEAADPLPRRAGTCCGTPGLRRRHSLQAGSSAERSARHPVRTLRCERRP